MLSYPPLRKGDRYIQRCECGNGDLGSGWQNRILSFVCARMQAWENKGVQYTVTIAYSKVMSVMSANSYAEKGVLMKIIRSCTGLVQDHVPGQVFEVVRILFAL